MIACSGMALVGQPKKWYSIGGAAKMALGQRKRAIMAV